MKIEKFEITDKQPKLDGPNIPLYLWIHQRAMQEGLTQYKNECPGPEWQRVYETELRSQGKVTYEKDK